MMTLDAATELARQHYDNRRLDEAGAVCDAIIAAAPRHAPALAIRGYVAFRNGDSGRAAELLSQAVAAAPDDAALHWDLGQILLSLGQSGAAEQAWRRAVDLAPDPDRMHTLANLLFQQDRLAECGDVLSRIVEHFPEDISSWSDLGEILHRQGRDDEALAVLRQAVARAPTDQAHVGLANLLCGMGRLDEVDTVCRAGLERHPDQPQLSLYLGIALLVRRRVTEAIPFICNAVLLAPDDRRAWVWFAGMLRHVVLLPLAPDIADLLLRALDHPAVNPRTIANSVAGSLMQSPGLADWSERIGDDDAGLPALLEQLAADPLLRRLLESGFVPSIAMERLLVRVRRGLLDAVLTRSGLPAAALDFAATLAMQCFLNEYVYFVEPDETGAVKRLHDRLDQAIAAGAEVPPLDLAVLACYRPLWRLEAAGAIAGRRWPDALAGLIRLQLTEPLEECRLAETIPAATAIGDAVSRKVRAQYEGNPYPRWRRFSSEATPTTLEQLHRSLGSSLERPEPPSRPKVLVAGCGSGRHALMATARLPDAEVLAVDLSRASLAHAIRKTRELGVSSIEYRHGDILELRQLDRRFDLIECCGVLHHMADPLAGWRVLADCLKPGGLMLIALYSEAGRRHVVACREHIARQGHADDDDSIRRLRRDIMALPADHPMAGAMGIVDFFSLSECRDLLFHVQEHRFTLPAIAAAIAGLGLDFLGFDDNATIERFRARFPGTPLPGSLEQWHVLETETPGLFTGMYQFWLRKPG